jgi:hypothetical protein
MTISFGGLRRSSERRIFASIRQRLQAPAAPAGANIVQPTKRLESRTKPGCEFSFSILKDAAWR